jgi:hypothetical protein
MLHAPLADLLRRIGSGREPRRVTGAGAHSLQTAVTVQPLLRFFLARVLFRDIGELPRSRSTDNVYL